MAGAAAPCRPPERGSGVLPLATAGTILALGCGGEPGAGNEIKRLYLSNDGGRTWRRLARLPFPGYLGTVSLGSGLTIVASGGRSDVYISWDGGQTSHTIDLEGHELIPVEVGHSDTDASTVLSVPDIGLVVAGDAVYNDVHQYLRESGPEGRRAWMAALDTIESLHPRAVIAGHQRAGRHDGPEIIEETRQYIRDVDRAVETTQTSRELYDKVLALYPERVNPGMLWWSARALKP
jgi:glyoxylase-like metal-dependent hydrolase (beta-lactamase superfamily II)